MHRSNEDSILSTVTTLNHTTFKSRYDKFKYESQQRNRQYAKLAQVLELREHNLQAYPWYLFDPQLHIDFPAYHLSHPIESTVVYCRENDFWSIFKTDEVGFRNPTRQINTNIDFIFIGDSFAEGACVDDKDTFAGIFRDNGLSVMNLGRGGSGPLFQLATLREYGASVKATTVLWFVFTGNDLYNLREEKTTRLFRYLENENYSQNLLRRKQEVSEYLKTFLDREIMVGQERRRLGLPNPFSHDYGETLDYIEAEQKEVVLLERVAEQILMTSKRLRAQLFVVIINHPEYDQMVQDITSKSIVDFAQRTRTGYFVLPREQLIRQKDILFSKGGPHFSPDGYRRIAGKVLDALSKHHLTTGSTQTP